MQDNALREMLERVACGALTPDQAVETLRRRSLGESAVGELQHGSSADQDIGAFCRKVSGEKVLGGLRGQAFAELGFAKIDTDRAWRTGYPEVIFCEGKTPEQSAAIFAHMAGETPLVIGTRATPAHYSAVKQALSDAIFVDLGIEAVYFEDARMIAVGGREQRGLFGIEKGGLTSETNMDAAVVTAGTADIPVAEEAARTLQLYGHSILRVYDVGVAGIHRLLARIDEIRQADVVIAVAGMEGALASVLGGLVFRPVIAVPTSVGYGASMGGLTALLAMLNSCSLGVSVMNIDNGFGAGHLAAMMLKLRAGQTE